MIEDDRGLSGPGRPAVRAWKGRTPLERNSEGVFGTRGTGTAAALPLARGHSLRKRAQTEHVPEDFVRLVAELEVEPAQLAVVPADDEVVARGVHVHRGDPADAWGQRLEQLLLGEVVHPHVSLRLCGVRTFMKSIISISIQSDAAKAKREDHGSRRREGEWAV